MQEHTLNKKAVYSVTVVSLATASDRLRMASRDQDIRTIARDRLRMAGRDQDNIARIFYLLDNQR
jgi:hypothetical protein